MIRKLLIASMVLVLVGFAAAQDTTTLHIEPTMAPDADDVISKGPTEASVAQDVVLTIPQATALHLDASTINFDITALDGKSWAERAASGERPEGFGLACVYAKGADDSGGVTNPLGDDYWGQNQVLPGGTKYEAETYPNISITGKEVVNYPPLRLKDGELDTGSKNYIVCYQSFIIQLFSNFPHWDLSVTRSDDTSKKSIEHLYVQGNTCSDFGKPTGLYGLNNDTTVHLIPKRLTAGTTGSRVNSKGSSCLNANTSWLDVLGVLAVKINSDAYGESHANLTYTLLSQDGAF
ncbi:MAG TPA: hypothetical protein PLT07_10680 [Trueperaceae bacterium]|nr:hypothetical protein [Trueperaceae bacterium]